MESLSSFIGVDGTNTTLNSGRIQINLKPSRAAEVVERSEVIRRLAAARWRQVDGIHCFHAAGAGPDGGRPGEPDAVPVLAGGSRTRKSWRSGRPSWSRSSKRFRCCAMWRPISRTNGLEAQPGDRSRHGVAAGNYAAEYRRHAVRCVCAAAGVDDLHAAEPVPCGAGGRAEVPEESGVAATTFM